jgi:hypothetical protein
MVSHLTSDDIKTLKDLSANPSDSYLLHFINNMQIVVVTEFKRKLKDFIKKEDANFYQDIKIRIAWIGTQIF